MTSDDYLKQIDGLIEAINNRDEELCAGIPDWCLDNFISSLSYWRKAISEELPAKQGRNNEEMLKAELSGLGRSVMWAGEDPGDSLSLVAIIRERLQVPSSIYPT